MFLRLPKLWALPMSGWGESDLRHQGVTPSRDPELLTFRVCLPPSLPPFLPPSLPPFLPPALPPAVGGAHFRVYSYSADTIEGLGPRTPAVKLTAVFIPTKHTRGYLLLADSRVLL